MFRKKQFLKKIICLFFALNISLLLCGCDGNRRFIFTTGFSSDELFRIEKESCFLPEYLVYLITLRNRYQDVYGEGIWDVGFEGETLAENIKNTALAKIAQVKTMNLLAKSRGVKLDDSDKSRVRKAAGEYFNSLSDEEVASLNVSFSLIEDMYKEYALAEKVYRDVVKTVDTEISDEDARTVSVQQILLKTYYINGLGERVEYMGDAKLDIYNRACSLREQALGKPDEFLTLASKNTEQSPVSFSIGKGEIDKELEDIIFNLSKNSFSEVIEDEEGYHVYKCISTFDRAQTDANKLKILEKRRQDVFCYVYDSFVEGLVRNINTVLWDNIVLDNTETVTTESFFEVYNRHFEQ